MPTDKRARFDADARCDNHADEFALRGPRACSCTTRPAPAPAPSPARAPAPARTDAAERSRLRAVAGKLYDPDTAGFVDYAGTVSHADRAAMIAAIVRIDGPAHGDSSADYADERDAVVAGIYLGAARREDRAAGRIDKAQAPARVEPVKSGPEPARAPTQRSSIPTSTSARSRRAAAARALNKEQAAEAAMNEATRLAHGQPDPEGDK